MTRQRPPGIHHHRHSYVPRPLTADRPCRVRTASLVTTHRARALQVRFTSPPLLRSVYLLQCFPHLSPPPSELRLGRVLRRLDRVLTVVQPIGLTVELPSTTHGPLFLEDVDRKDSRTNSTRCTPGSTEATPETALCLIASLVYFIILEFP